MATLPETWISVPISILAKINADAVRDAVEHEKTRIVDARSKIREIFSTICVMGDRVVAFRIETYAIFYNDDERISMRIGSTTGTFTPSIEYSRFRRLIEEYIAECLKTESVITIPAIEDGWTLPDVAAWAGLAVMGIFAWTWMRRIH